MICGVGALLACVLFLGRELPAQSLNVAPGAVHILTLDQAITPATARIVDSALKRAFREKAELLIVRLDTPGGLLEATRNIVQSLLSSKIPVVVFIAPAGARGASAGTMITMAAHVAAMAPATHIGAAHPVSLFGGGDDNQIMGQKILNDTAAFMRSVAETRGRNADWAVAAVRDSESITSDQALELGVIEILAENLADLIDQVHDREIRLNKDQTVLLSTRGRPVFHFEPSFSENFQSWISDPNILFLLIIAALAGLYIEFTNPGLIFPGIGGAMALVLALIAIQTLPVSLGALGLLLLGGALLVAESFVPSFGVLGISGLASLVVGSLFLIDQDLTDLQVSRPLIFSAVFTLGAIMLLIGKLLLRSLRVPLQSLQANMVGQSAVALKAASPLSPGEVLLKGERWQATSAEPIEAGQTVEVESLEGLILRVKTLEPPSKE